MRSKNGQPHQNTTGVASSELDPVDRGRAEAVAPAPRPSSMSPIVQQEHRAPSATPIQKRRVMSASSGFGASVRSGDRVGS